MQDRGAPKWLHWSMLLLPLLSLLLLVGCSEDGTLAATPYGSITDPATGTWRVTPGKYISWNGDPIVAMFEVANNGDTGTFRAGSEEFTLRSGESKVVQVAFNQDSTEVVFSKLSQGWIQSEILCRITR